MPPSDHAAVDGDYLAGDYLAGDYLAGDYLAGDVAGAVAGMIAADRKVRRSCRRQW